MDNNWFKIIKKNDKDLAQDKIFNDVFKMTGMNKIYLLGFVNAFDSLLSVMGSDFEYKREDIFRLFKDISKSEDFDEVKEVCQGILKKYNVEISTKN